MTPREALDKLRALSPILEHVPYEEIIFLLKDSIQKIPLSLAKMPAGTAIDRARKNDAGKLYNNVHQQLSYIRDQYVIDNYLKEYGRANKPHQPMFYGAIESTRIGTQRVTAIAETSELFQNRAGVNFDGELYTISRWKTNTELTLVEIVFAQAAIDNNPDIKAAYAKQVDFAMALGLSPEDLNFFKEFLVFISEEFAREKKTHNDYKISVAYTELALSNPDIHGITYPSVQTQYWGQNVVFAPAVVDRFLEISMLSTQRLHKNKMLTLVTNHKNCLNPAACHEAIVWTSLAPEHMTSKKEIDNYLNGPQQKN